MIQAFEFGEVVADQFEPVVTIAATPLELAALLVERTPREEGVAYSGRLRIECAAGVEQLALVSAARQRLELELAVHVDEVLAERAQRLHRHGLSVDVGAAAAVGRDDPAQLDFALVLDRLFLEPGHRARVAIDVERRGHLGPLGAVAHGATVCAPSHGQQQGIHQDGLAGASLAGEGGEAGLELELDGLDDREVANLQVSQHRALQPVGGWPPLPLRPQCSFERRMRK